MNIQVILLKRVDEYMKVSFHFKSGEAGICQEVVSSSDPTRELEIEKQRRHLLLQRRWPCIDMISVKIHFPLYVYVYIVTYSTYFSAEVSP